LGDADLGISTPGTGFPCETDGETAAWLQGHPKWCFHPACFSGKLCPQNFRRWQMAVAGKPL